MSINSVPNHCSNILDMGMSRNRNRILQWFSNFASSGYVDHTKGAKALSQFAFVNRDICWEELEWKGKHGQSPAMVATKPHYFLDLDVERTVENFLEYVPEFWSSKEFAESLRDGDILTIDNNFFINMFVDLMYKDNLKEVWEIIDEFLIEQSFSFLCQHLLIILEEQDLMVFLDLLQSYVKPSLQKKDCHDSLDQVLKIILSKCDGNNSLDQLLLLNAVATQSRQLIRFIREEGSQEQKEKVRHVVFQICKPTNPKDTFTPILRECFRRKSLETIKWLGLQSWAFYCYLSEDFRNSSSWENLFVCNNISFRKSKTYPILDHDQLLEESESEQDNRSARNKRKKRQKHRKKKRRDIDFEELNGDEFADVITNQLELHSTSGDWLLSTDGYSTTWSSIFVLCRWKEECGYLDSLMGLRSGSSLAAYVLQAQPNIPSSYHVSNGQSSFITICQCPGNPEVSFPSSLDSSLSVDLD
ncbi:hypothetical protein KY290_036724 [Solanum tuberosum]|uniref:Uncharacterized protein n=1 Tax=Solanum tuberosum TaxID=4113 RepID=A0ABQ7TVD4_SOLTU|nr:hypothetical protein KY289_037899 [Solanum tuberosum]KAH0639454.1 hypothetical protein KY285_036040 [Solanum tuberosum]KAH0738019.1 hypothetical protein KY290_036724 [Solanum tuberosum]